MIKNRKQNSRGTDFYYHNIKRIDIYNWMCSLEFQPKHRRGVENYPPRSMVNIYIYIYIYIYIMHLDAFSIANAPRPN
jgi:hypothetical protein